MITLKVYIRILIASLFCYFSFNSYSLSQTLSHQLLSSSGHYQENKTSLSWTTGQTVIQTVGVDSVFLTQGFQQIFIDIPTIINESFSKVPMRINIYPNPAHDYIHVVTGNNTSGNGGANVKLKTNGSNENVPASAVESEFSGGKTVPDYQQQHVKLEIYNTKGTLLHSQFLHHHHTRISFEHYSKGVYLVHATYKNKRKIFKVIKDK